MALFIDVFAIIKIKMVITCLCLSRLPYLQKKLSRHTNSCELCKKNNKHDKNNKIKRKMKNTSKQKTS